MTNRERFHAVMNGDPAVDRYPVLEWATWWDKTVREWEGAGLREGLDSWGLFDTFGLDHLTQFWLSSRGPGCPWESSHGSGIIKDRGDYLRIRPYLYPKDAINWIAPQIEAVMPRYGSGDAIVWYTLDGFFWFPRTLFGIEGHFLAFYDYPELYREICEDLLEWEIEMVGQLGRYLKADFMTIAEDMSYNHGPMLSKELYDEFMAPYYRRLIPEIKKYGTKVFIDSDGNIHKAVPWFIEAGIEGVLPLERQSGVDISQIRADYPDFLMLGGFDKMCLFRGKAAIDREFERILPVIRSGRYIPSMDHQTPPGVTMENYRYYVERLREYGRYACKSE